MEESFETGELQEKLNEALERAEKAGEERSASPSWIGFLSLSTAVIAVLAAIAASLAGSHSNNAILEKNEAILAQAQAQGHAAGGVLSCTRLSARSASRDSVMNNSTSPIRIGGKA